MNKDGFSKKYNQAIKDSNKHFSGKISDITQSLLKQLSPDKVNLPTLQAAIDFSLKINEISEQRSYFILKRMFTNEDDS